MVVTSFCVAMFGWGFGFYGLGVYLPELQGRHGWSASLIGTATTAYYLFSACLLPLFGAAVRKFGPRTVVLTGTVAMGASVFSLTLITSPWQLFAAYLLMAVGWSAMSITAINLLIAPWFVKRRGLAISLALTGASIGGIVVAPGLVWLASIDGFNTAVIVGVSVMIVVLVPLVTVFVRRGPEELGLDPDGDAPVVSTHNQAMPQASAILRPSHLLSSWRFWSIAAPFALALVASVGFITHQIAFLEPALGQRGAALAVALTTTAAVVGRFGLGLFVDRLDQRAVTAASLASQAVALLAMLQADSPAALYAASILFGLSVGNLITLPTLIVQREYRAHEFGLVVGLVTATCQVAFAFGPGLLGFMRDMAGSYDTALAFCASLQVLGAVTVLLRPVAGEMKT